MMDCIDHIDGFEIVTDGLSVSVIRALDDEGHEPGTAFLMYWSDCKEPKTVHFPMAYSDLFDPQLEIVVLDRVGFAQWFNAVRGLCDQWRLVGH